ncbi:MAG: hypothetical protein V3R52_05315 [Candidatus Neomarinimicrobiota bacterium]
MNSHIQKVIELPVELTDYEFHPTKFRVGATGYYFLDDVNRQIAFLSNNGNIIFAGGYGIENDAFIDPIDILTFKLRIFILDKSENKLIDFDHKLNYLHTHEFDPIYPEFSGIDDWGNIFLLSEQEQKIFKTNILTQNLEEFIDLSLWNNVYDCITDIHIAVDGSIGILANCNESALVFNRLGRLENEFLIENTNSNFIIKLLNEWFIINNEQQILSIRNNEKVNLQTKGTVLDVDQKDGSLYILSSDKIWIVDVSME